MERLRLWRYKKLANENIKEPKVNEKLADDEDYSSCFKLRKSLKVKLNLLIYNNAPSRGCQTELNQPPISRGDELIINEAASRLYFSPIDKSHFPQLFSIISSRTTKVNISFENFSLWRAEKFYSWVTLEEESFSFLFELWILLKFHKHSRQSSSWLLSLVDLRWENRDKFWMTFMRDAREIVDGKIVGVLSGLGRQSVLMADILID